MKTKTSLLCGAAIGMAVTLGLGANAEAKTVKHAKPAATTVEQQEIADLKAQVQALTARLDAEASARMAAQQQVAQTQTQVAQTQAQVAQTQAQVDKVVADSESVQTRLDDVPTQVLATLSEVPKPAPSWAGSTSINGRMYFDMSSISQKSNGAKVAPTGTGFDIKRFYVGIDHKFNDVFSANVTTDFQYSSAISATEIYLKKAYLQAALMPELTVRVGAADLPWIPFVEDIYGYRYAEKTLVDRLSYGTSSDWGVHALGNLGPYVSYAVAVIDGAGYKAPLRSKPMDVEGRVSAKFDDITVAVGGYTGKLGKDTEGATNIFHTASRFDVLAAYVHGPIRVGGEYFTATDWNNVTTVAPDKTEGYSVWGSYAFTPEFALFGKYEWAKPKKLSAPTNDDNYFNFGLQYEPVKIVDLSLMYKRDKVENGSISTGNGTIGGTKEGTYDEVGVFGQFRW